MFELDRALLLAKICKATYLGDGEVFTNINEPARIKTLADQLVTILHYDYCTIIAFRGTATIGGWIKDLNIALKKNEAYQGYVHNGFATALEGLFDWIIPKLPKDVPIQVTGHSLGGALATLLVTRLKSNLMPLYTFGAPKVGDAEFVTKFEIEHYRVVNDMDPIPHLPLDPYKHTGEEIRLPECGSPSLWRIVTNLYAHIKNGLASTIIEAIKDHDITEYTKALEGKA